jgi:ABC-type uncharacterized transport system auxiliary subunit
MKKLRCLLFWIAPVLTLVGCGNMFTSDAPPEHVYWLESTALRLGEAPAERLPALIVEVDTIPGLDTDRILVKGPGARMNHYAGARWPDHLPEVVTALVRLSIESSGRFSRVGSRPQIASNEWSLELEVREFFAVATTADGPPTVHVQLAGHLKCDSSDATVNATATASTNENKLSDIVAAFQSATNQAMVSLGGQLEDTCFQ